MKLKTYMKKGLTEKLILPYQPPTSVKILYSPK